MLQRFIVYRGLLRKLFFWDFFIMISNLDVKVIVDLVLEIWLLLELMKDFGIVLQCCVDQKRESILQLWKQRGRRDLLGDGKGMREGFGGEKD